MFGSPWQARCGVDVAAHGLDWRLSDNGVVPAGAFPSLPYAWYHLRARRAQTLAEQQSIVALRPLGMRLSPHFYNAKTDVATLLDALKRI